MTPSITGPQSVVIIAPYGRTEVTEAALRVADHATILGLPVKVFASPGGKADSVHPAWDHRVYAVGHKYNDLYGRSAKHTHAVHFRHDHKAFNACKAANPNAKPILVLDWHAPLPGGKTLAQYHKIVCPTHAAYFAAKRADIPDEMLVKCRWDAGVTPTPRTGLRQTGRVSSVWMCGRAVKTTLGRDLMTILATALMEHPHLGVTLVTDTAWPCQSPDFLPAYETGRLMPVGVSTFLERDRLFQLHDWVVFPAPYGTYGCAAAAAMARGAAVLASDVPPWNEYVAEGCGGRLVPADMLFMPGKLKAPVAATTTIDWLAAIATAMSPARAVHLARAASPPFGKDQRQFAKAWDKVFDLNVLPA